ncbi:lysosomal acid phosphatase [Harpegnathos saltator]|uniref:Lysosomal acid phosphatase n=1 Tax=Harpegnathos saltator TaxID=610380 RepID=E2C6V5_HARSA|nr:lysosomal acid phosphatase [Harpegnathos saltator]EFN76309.1 Lysosomal acid phosphatase [Harpegnathos saltator]
MDLLRRQGSNYHSGKCGVCVSVIVLGTFIGCMLLAYTTFASPTSKYDTLQQVVFLFRHGDRTPTETYPKDPYINYSWPGGWGAMTKKGMLQLYNVGQWIRKEYGEAIGKKYESASTLVRSTYADRCIMSAQTLLAGLFPPSPEDMFVSGLEWTPIPVHAIPREMDKLIAVKSSCPRLAAALKQAYLEEEERSGEKMADYYKELTEHTGKNMSTITDVEFLYNTLEIEEEHGLKLPTWTRKFYNDEMREIAARSLAIFTDGVVQKRLRGGPLVKEILQHMEERNNAQLRSKRTYFYSAHDITIVNVMRTMGFTSEYLKPEYGAMLILELHHADNENQEVKILYLKSAENRETSLLQIPNCPRPCLLQNLKQAWREVIPDNWDEECKM